MAPLVEEEAPSEPSGSLGEAGAPLADSSAPEEDAGDCAPGQAIQVFPEGCAKPLAVPQAVENLLARKPVKPSKIPQVHFAHGDPTHPVVYGGWFGECRAPAVFLQAPSQELVSYILDDPLGPFASFKKNGKEQWKKWGFHEDERETIHKADWHAVPHIPGRARVFVPRHAEKAGLMPAPRRVMAFVMALRAVNQPCWNAIIDALVGLRIAHEQEKKEYATSDQCKVLRSIIDCFRNQRHFGVVEAQVRWGEESRKMPSHKDGATSMLHLGVTLGGHRVLRAGIFKAATAIGNLDNRSDESRAANEGPENQQAELGEKDVWNLDVWKAEHLNDMEMTPGCMYISSPFVFEHAVEYSACDESEPVIALQCRFAFPDELGQILNNMRTKETWEVSTIIAEVLKTAGKTNRLRLPTVNEVKQGEKHLQRMDDERAEKRAKAELEALKSFGGSMTFAG